MKATTIGFIVTIVAALAFAGVATASTQQVFAGGSCTGCAKAFAPGQLAINSGLSASNFAPGHEVPPGPSSHGASDFAPGIEKTIPTGPGP